jgi:hypothetical protein
VGVEISEIFKASDQPTRQRGAHQTLNLCIYFPSHKRVGSLHELLEKQTLLSHPHNGQPINFSRKNNLLNWIFTIREKLK